MAERAPAVAVLGAGGFIGSHLCDALAGLGHEVVGFGRGPQPPEAAGIRWVEGDFNDPGQVCTALAGCGVVFDLVGSSTPSASNADPIRDLNDTVTARVRLLEALRAEPPRRLICLSSGGTVYGATHGGPVAETMPTEPLCAYGISKLMVEKHLALHRHLYGLDYCILRVSNAFGERQRVRRQQGVVAAFLSAATAGRPLEVWGDGSVVRDYVYVGDVVDALVRCIGVSDFRHRVINIGSAVGRSVLDVVDGIQRAVGRPLDVQFRPGRKADAPHIVLDTRRAHETLGWQAATPWEEALERTCRWYLGQTALTES